MASQSKSSVVKVLMENYPKAFTTGLTPPDDEDGYGKEAPPSVVVLDALTRAHKAGKRVVLAPVESGVSLGNTIADDDEDHEENGDNGSAIKTWFHNVCEFMLDPGLKMMPKNRQEGGARTFIVTAEGPKYCPVKDMTRLKRTAQSHNKKKLTKQQRCNVEMAMHWRSDDPIEEEWSDVLRDSYLRNIFLHRMAAEAFENKELPINCRMVFDGCIRPDIDHLIREGCSMIPVEETAPRPKYDTRYIHVIEGRKEMKSPTGQDIVADKCEREGTMMKSTISEGEQALYAWVKWGCDPVKQRKTKESDPDVYKERKAEEKVFLLISNDTDAVLTGLQVVQNYLLLPEGLSTGEDWTMGQHTMRARVVLWLGKTTQRDAAGNEVLTDLFVWLPRLWHEITKSSYERHRNNMLHGLCPIYDLHHPVMNLIASIMVAADDFSPGIDGLPHHHWIKSWRTYGSWIGNLVVQGYKHEPGKLIDHEAFMRLIRATYFLAYASNFKGFDHPEKLDYATMVEIVREKFKVATERHVPSLEELEGVRLRIEFHMGYNDLAPLNREWEMHDRVLQYGYNVWTPETPEEIASGMKACTIPSNMKLVKDEKTGLLLCVKKNHRPRAPRKDKSADNGEEGDAPQKRAPARKKDGPAKPRKRSKAAD